VTANGDSIATDEAVTQQDEFAGNGSPTGSGTGPAGGEGVKGRPLADGERPLTEPGAGVRFGPEADFLRPVPSDLPTGPADPREVNTDSIRHPSTALEPVAALLGWLSLAAIGAAGLATKIAHHRLSFVSPWVAVFVAGTVVSIILAARLKSALGVRRLLAEVHRSYPPLYSVDARESSRRADGYLSDLLERSTNFVGGRAGALYVASLGSGKPTLLTSVGMELTSRAVGIAIDAAVTEARPATMADEGDRSWMVLSAPLVIGGRVTGVLVVSAPKRWSKTSRLPRLQQIADGSAAVIERARLGEEEWRNRLGVAHARGHLAILAEAAVTLSVETESTDEAFQRLGEVVVPDFADWFAVHLDDGSGLLSSVAVGRKWAASNGRNGTRHPAVGEKGGHLHPEGEALVRTAMATRGSVVSSDLAAGYQEPGRNPGSEPALSLMQAPPTETVGSLMVVPIEVHGRTVGALSFVNLPGRRGFRPSDLETAGTLAGSVAATAERILLVEQSEVLSAAADRRANRLRRLVETALVVSTPLSENEVLQVLAEHARRVLTCERVVVACRRGGLVIEASAPPDPGPADISAVLEATDRVLGGSRSSHAPSTMGVASFRISDGESTATPDWVAAPVDQATGMNRRAMVAIGRGAEPFGPDEEAVLALLARMASVALERAALYETLRSNEQRLTALVESSPLAIAELDLDGTVRWWNRAAGCLFGWDDSGPTARTIPVTGEATAMLGALWERARLGQATVGALVPARRPSGEIMELSLSVAPLCENDGTTGGILAVVEDATEREQVLEQFHRSQRLGAMARLAGGIAHDFNNLVTVILGSSETLMARIDPDDPLRAEVEAINRVGKRAAALTGQLLQIGHRSSVQLVETDPAEVIVSMTDELRRLLGGEIELEITNDHRHSPLLVLVDRAELERAVLNLAFNAHDAMPQGGRLTINTRFVRDESGPRCWVVISVTDTGIGMDPRTAEHCFEPFFTTKGSASGTGLGLATVHATITQANGSVNVESTPGVGTTFTLRFPLAHDGTEEMPADRFQDSNL
jgi:PAS domain S-box-containing protein